MPRIVRNVGGKELDRSVCEDQHHRVHRATTSRHLTAAAAWLIVAAATFVGHGAGAAYFHETHRADALNLSDVALKAHFVVTGIPHVVSLPGAEAMEMLAAPDGIGLFEQTDGIRAGAGRCGEDGPKVRRCVLTWEAGNLTRSKGAAARKATTLTLKSSGGQTLALPDWDKCAPHHDCDGEHFTFLGPLGRSAYLATEIGYGHDSPSLVLFHAQSGKLVFAHYGSEPTFLNPAGTLLVNSEDLNDATSLLVTDLAGGIPAIDLQCLGARSAEKSFGVTFKRWISDTAFEIGFTETLAAKGSTPATSRMLPVRFERDPAGAWRVMSTVDLKATGIECRERRATRGK